MILEIVIIVFIAKQFNQLAKKYNQKLPWAYAIAGIVSYYGGAFIGGILIGIYMELSGNYFLEGVSDLFLGLIFLPIGILICWGLYYLLNRKWKKEFEEKERNKPKISDIGKSDENFF